MAPREGEEETLSFFGKVKEAEAVKGRLPRSTRHVDTFFGQALDILAFFKEAEVV